MTGQAFRAADSSRGRIAFVTGCMVRGGAERVISLIANRYGEAGYDVDILMILKPRSDYPLHERVRLLDLSDGGARRSPLHTVKKIRRYLRDTRPLAVISFMARINAVVGLACRKGRGYRLILSERNDPRYDRRGFLLNALLRFAYRRSDAVVFQTDYARALAPRSCPGTLIPNPISVPDDGGSAFQKQKVILSAGRFMPQKNQKLLIEAFALFHKKHPDYVLKIFGFGDLKPALEKQISEVGLTGAAFLLPDTPDIHQEMRRAEIFALSSDYEGLSNALLEAMCLGMSVVSTDCSGISEYLVNRQNGLLSPVGDAKAFAACLDRLASDSAFAAQLGKNARKLKERVCADTVWEAWDRVIFGNTADVL